MKNTIVKKETTGNVHQQAISKTSPTPRVSWPTLSPEEEVAFRGEGGLTALSAALGAAERRARFHETRVEGEPFAASPMPLGKRAFDIIFATLALLFSMPILLACAIAIKLESGGPIFFMQRRLGRCGKPFSIIKFRTMVPDAELVLVTHLASNPEAQAEWNADRKLRHDPRVTRLGRTMRRLSLDELPQFWNVLRGDMSVVGPRPIVPAEVSKYSTAFRDYCTMRPGITGLWQVSGRNDIGYAERVALDRQYASSISPLTDLKILLRTVRAVLCADGSY